MDNHKIRRQIILGGIVSYVTIGLNIVLGLIYTPWILHVVGSSDYGLYTLASSLIALFLLDFGMSTAVSRFISNYRAENDQDRINAFFGLSLKLYLSICLIIAIALSIIYYYLGDIYHNLTVNELTSFKKIYITTIERKK